MSNKITRKSYSGLGCCLFQHNGKTLIEGIFFHSDWMLKFTFALQSKSTVVYAYCLHLSSIDNSGSVKTRSFSSLLKCGSRFSFEGMSDGK